jgi:hypothetical protein
MLEKTHRHVRNSPMLIYICQKDENGGITHEVIERRLMDKKSAEAATTYFEEGEGKLFDTIS